MIVPHQMSATNTPRRPRATLKTPALTAPAPLAVLLVGDEAEELELEEAVPLSCSASAWNALKFLAEVSSELTENTMPAPQ